MINKKLKKDLELEIDFDGTPLWSKLFDET